VSSFAATLDGKGHKVYNFSVESTDAKSGLVLVNTGTIKNVVFGSADGKTYDGKSSISAVEGAGGEFAGLVGDNAGTLENVTTFVTVNYVAGTEKPSDYIGVGGLAGTASLAGTFVNCTNYATFNTSGTLTQEMGIGGILGYTKSKDVTITSCVNAANLTITMPVAKVIMIGGIAGRTNGTIVIDKCENKGDISYEQAEKPGTWMAIGGIGGVFYNGITLTNCHIEQPEVSVIEPYAIYGINNHLIGSSSITETVVIKAGEMTGIDELGVRNEESGVTDLSDAEIYDLSGRRISQLQPGINVIRTKDGKVYKITKK
jgi:hypothetical protein